MLAFIDAGWVGSPIDAATLILVLTMFVYEMRPRQSLLSAAVVALAEGRRDIDHRRLQSELEVDDVEVDAVRTRIWDGGDDDP